MALSLTTPWLPRGAAEQWLKAWSGGLWVSWSPEQGGTQGGQGAGSIGGGCDVGQGHSETELFWAVTKEHRTADSGCGNPAWGAWGGEGWGQGPGPK